MPVRPRLTAVLLTAAALGAAVVPAAADARATTVKVGSTGNAAFDDICRQMGDLINEEVSQGVNEELNGHFGEANAWFSQAAEHTTRAQGMGCNMTAARKVPARGRPARASTVSASSASKARTTSAKPVGPRPTVKGGGTTVMAKKISGHAGGGKGDWSQKTCDAVAGYVNDALDHQQSSAQAGDPGAAAGWHQHANELLSAGMSKGCSFTAS